MAGAESTDSRLGRFVEVPVGGEVVRAFVPPPLPPRPPTPRGGSIQVVLALVIALFRGRG